MSPDGLVIVIEFESRRAIVPEMWLPSTFKVSVADCGISSFLWQPHRHNNEQAAKTKTMHRNESVCRGAAGLAGRTDRSRSSVLNITVTLSANKPSRSMVPSAKGQGKDA